MCILSRSGFQFLMVRLKAGYWSTERNSLSISIPYGSIKRYNQMGNWIIKYKFQFLMVRLKASSLRPVAYAFSISIPYGSIKSYRVIKCAEAQSVFQFLMVRLKAANSGTRNFPAFIISIPYGSIKRQTVYCTSSAAMPYFNSLWFD